MLVNVNQMLIILQLKSTFKIMNVYILKTSILHSKVILESLGLKHNNNHTFDQECIKLKATNFPIMG